MFSVLHLIFSRFLVLGIVYVAFYISYSFINCEFFFNRSAFAWKS